VPLVQVPSLLAQCAPGVWSYQPQRARPCTTPSTLLLSKDLELPVFIIPLCFASMVYHWIDPATAESVVPFTPVRHWTQPLCVGDCSVATDARPLAVLSPEGSEQHRLVNQLDTMARR
jgi:hypothetical protein